MTRFSPQPLRSYGFLIDFFLYTDEAFPCVRDTSSRFYVSAELSGTALKFDISPECQAIIPTFDSFTYDGKYLEIAIYGVDKMTGQQAMLYQGSPCEIKGMAPNDCLITLLSPAFSRRGSTSQRTLGPMCLRALNS